jgi:HprK-related kinase A
LLTTSDEALALAYLVWQINQRAVAESGARLLLHAAAAARDESAVLLPAPSGAGKSTLVAGLVAAGFEYLTDDVCALDANGSCAVPYPKPIAIATPAVRELFDRPGAPLITGERSRFVGEEAFLSAADLGGTIASRAVAASLVVVPAYRAGAATRLEPLSRAEAAVLLAEQSFNFNELGGAGLFAIGELVRGCTCHRLTYSDLAAGVACISELLAA